VNKPRATATRVVPATLDALDALDADTLVLLLAEDQRPLLGAAGLLDWRMNGWISRQLKDGIITGKRGERVLSHASGRVPVQRVMLFGVGPEKGPESRLQDLMLDVGRALEKANIPSVALAAPGPHDALMRALESAPASLKDRVRAVLDGDAL
jgi:hypothetical protein